MAYAYWGQHCQSSVKPAQAQLIDVMMVQAMGGILLTHGHARRLSSEVQQLHGQLHATGAEQQRAAEEALKLQAANETLQRQLKVMRHGIKCLHRFSQLCWLMATLCQRGCCRAAPALPASIKVPLHRSKVWSADACTRLPCMG